MKNEPIFINRACPEGCEGTKTREGSKSAVMPGSDADTLQRMTEAAMKKAVELGVMWKYVEEGQYLQNRDNMKEIIKAALLAG